MPTVLVCGALLGGHFYYYYIIIRKSCGSLRSHALYII